MYKPFDMWYNLNIGLIPCDYSVENIENLKGVNDMLSAKAICSNCNNPMTINANVLIRQSIVMVDDGKQLDMLSYVCDECKSLHTVQIDDDETKRKLRMVTAQVAKIAKSKQNKNNKGQGQKYVEQNKKARTDLTELRMDLVRKYDGKDFYHNGERKTLHFEILI